MIRIAQIGYGYWGPNLLRNFMSLGNAKVDVLIDSLSERLDQASKLFPTLVTSTSADDAFNNNAIDAVVIATPVFTHYELAKRALLAGKHVLLEKPMTATVSQAKELIDLALDKGKLLMVDHTFLYNGAVEKMKALNKEISTTYLLHDYTPWLTARYSSAQSIGPGINLLRKNPALAKRIKSTGRKLNVWTVNDAADIKLCHQLGVDNLITNRPAYAREVLSNI